MPARPPTHGVATWYVRYDVRGFARSVWDRDQLARWRASVQAHHQARAGVPVEPLEGAEPAVDDPDAPGRALPICFFRGQRRGHAAHARLIAAAPALLRAARLAHDHLRAEEGPLDLRATLSEAVGLAEETLVTQASP